MTRDLPTLAMPVSNIVKKVIKFTDSLSRLFRRAISFGRSIPVRLISSIYV